MGSQVSLFLGIEQLAVVLGRTHAKTTFYTVFIASLTLILIDSDNILDGLSRKQVKMK